MRKLCARLSVSVVALLACDALPPSTAILERVEPTVVITGVRTELVLYGQGFGVKVKADFDDPRHSDVNARYAAYLVAEGAGESALLGVTRIDESRIAAVVPETVTPGVYAIRVVDPWGRLVRGDVSLEARAPTSQTSPCATDADCSDGVGCTSDFCGANGFCATRWQCGAVDVKACLSASQLVGTTETTFQFDASCAVGPQGTSFAFDFEGDGVFDVPHQPAPTASFRYAPGIYRPLVEVRSPLGASDRAQLRIVVVPAGDLVVVDTALDENDAGAAPQSPGGRGLSLREAIHYVNLAAVPKVITFSGPMTIDAAALPPLSAADAWIVGNSGVVLDFAMSPWAGSCVTLAGTRQHLVGVEVRGCPAIAVKMLGVDTEVVDCTLRSVTGSGQAAAVEARALFGPRNLVTGYDTTSHPVTVRASDVLIVGNRFSANEGAIKLESGALRAAIERNQLNSIAGDAIILAGSASANIRQNTFHQIAGTAIVGEIASSGGAIAVRGNILAGTPCALEGSVSKFAYLEPNLFPPDQSGCLGATVSGNVVGSALFVNPGAGDFRLLPGSPGIDASIDLGIDLNGAGAGNFNGAAPDFGAFESPY